MPDTYTKYEISDDDEIVDPPVIPEYERRITEATAQSDDTQIELVTEDYHEARLRIAKRHNERVDDRKSDDERVLARDRKNTEDKQREEASAREREEERARIETLRQEQTAVTTPNKPAEPDMGQATQGQGPDVDPVTGLPRTGNL